METQIRLVIYFQILRLLLIFASQEILKYFKILSAIVDLSWSLFKILFITALYISRLIFIFRVVPIVIDFWYSYNKVISDKKSSFLISYVWYLLKSYFLYVATQSFFWLVFGYCIFLSIILIFMSHVKHDFFLNKIFRRFTKHHI